MEKGHGKRRLRRRDPQLPGDRGEEAARRALRELVGEGAPPAQDRGEEAARRSRVVALIEALWAGLQQLGRLLGCVFFARRRQVELELPAAEDEEKLGGQGGGLSLLYRKLPGRHKKEPRRAPSPPPKAPRPLLIIKGKAVPADVEAQYREYCRRSACVPENSCLCHLCFFVESLHPNDTLPAKKMMTHCKNMHKTLGIKCDVQDCQVRVDTQRAKELHIHFLHPDFKG